MRLELMQSCFLCMQTHEMEKSNENQHHVFKSRRLSFRWSHRHSLDMTPIWFILRRSIAISFSWSFRNLASIGESGMKANMTNEKATVITPKKRNIIWPC